MDTKNIKRVHSPIEVSILGKVKRILASKKLGSSSPNKCGIELCETVHFHLPDGIRLEFTVGQFEVIAETFYNALQKWIELGKPTTAEFIPLANGNLPGVPVYPSRFVIEEQTIPTVHTHLRGLSIRRTIPDFKEFVDVFTEAKQNLTR